MNTGMKHFVRKGQVAWLEPYSRKKTIYWVAFSYTPHTGPKVLNLLM